MLGFFTEVLEKRLGAEVLGLSDPRELDARLSGFVPDVVLTDIELPGASGIDLISVIRARHPEVPVVITTAHVSVDYAVSALRQSADEFLAKPVSAARLVETLEPLIREGRQRRLKRSSKTVLAIGAHPDDVEIGVGGTLSAHSAAGDSIVILTMSRGARGGTAEDRHQESMAAAELLHARLFLEDLEDTKISGGDPTVGIIEKIVAEVRPDVVYVHSANDRHQDHRAVHAAAQIATRSVSTVCCYQSPSATVDFKPSRFVPIDEFTEHKLALLRCFESQAGIRDYLAPDFVLASARYWSRFGGGTHCEPLEVVRDTAGILPSVGSHAPSAALFAAEME